MQTKSPLGLLATIGLALSGSLRAFAHGGTFGKLGAASKPYAGRYFYRGHPKCSNAAGSKLARKAAKGSIGKAVLR